MAADTPPKVVFEHEGVFIHDREDHDLLSPGLLRLIEKDGDVVVEYRPMEDSVDPSSMLCAGKDSSSVMEWAQYSGERARVSPSPNPRVNPSPSPSSNPSPALDHQQSCDTEWDMINAVTFRRKPCSNGEGAVNSNVKRYSFSFSVYDLRSVTVREVGGASLAFRLHDSAPLLPALHFTNPNPNQPNPSHPNPNHGGAPTTNPNPGQAFLDTLRRYTLLTEAPDDESCLLVSAPNKALSQSFENLLDDNNFSLVHKLKKDPYVTTLGGFSKVTNYIFDAFRGADEPHQRPPEEVADLLGEVIPGLEINQQEEPGFEVITRVDLGVRPEVQRREPVSAEDWARHLDPEGRMLNVPDLKRLIFKGGLCHAIRREAWKFLLGYFPWDSSYEERKSLQRRKTDEYFRMKLQWKSISEEQERRNSRLRDYRSLIEKDVNRTDRTNRFYEGLDNPGLVLLHDILMTYCMFHFDLGYVQGMSDLLSPVLYVMENEVDAFWCFVSFMDQMHQNFEEQMQGMKTQLIQLSTLLRLLDLSFWNYLESQDSGYLYFCFRWLLIRFKRELSFQDVLRVWEVMWTGLPCQNFHLLLCCAILDSEKHKIMEENYGFNEILKHINELSMKLDVEEILHKAEALCMQIRRCKDLPHSISDILGFNIETQIPGFETRQLNPNLTPNPNPNLAPNPNPNVTPNPNPIPNPPGTSSPPRPTQRPAVFSNGHGHLREAPPNGCKVAFIS